MFAFSFKGRAGRGYFWWMGVILPISLFALKEWMIYRSVGVSLERISNGAIFLTDGFISLFVLWLQVAATVKRLHDMGYSSWFQFAYIMPTLFGCMGFMVSQKFGTLTFLIGGGITLIWILVHCGFCSGDPEKNSYGEPLD